MVCNLIKQKSSFILLATSDLILGFSRVLQIKSGLNILPRLYQATLILQTQTAPDGFTRASVHTPISGSAARLVRRYRNCCHRASVVRD